MPSSSPPGGKLAVRCHRGGRRSRRYRHESSRLTSRHFRRLRAGRAHPRRQFGGQGLGNLQNPGRDTAEPYRHQPGKGHGSTFTVRAVWNSQLCRRRAAPRASALRAASNSPRRGHPDTVKSSPVLQSIGHTVKPPAIFAPVWSGRAANSSAHQRPGPPRRQRRRLVSNASAARAAITHGLRPAGYPTHGRRFSSHQAGRTRAARRSHLAAIRVPAAAAPLR